MRLTDYLCKWLVIFSLPILWTVWLWVGIAVADHCSHDYVTQAQVWDMGY